MTNTETTITHSAIIQFLGGSVVLIIMTTFLYLMYSHYQAQLNEGKSAVSKDTIELITEPCVFELAKKHVNNKYILHNWTYNV